MIGLKINTYADASGTANTTYSKNRSIKYIVVHYTAGTNSAEGAARNTGKYFKSGNAGGSADFIVDDLEIVQYNTDILNRYCWSVGGVKYSAMSTGEGGKFHGKCTNQNSISVEMCSRKTNTSTLSASDTDWYITKEVFENTVTLVKHLMKTYGISSDCVIMHHHVTGKICPNPWCVNEKRLVIWENFKARIEEEDDMTEVEVKAIAKSVAEEVFDLKSETIYDSIDEMPEWAKDTIKKLVENGTIKGTGSSLSLSGEMLRTLVILDRAGIFG